jgi:hypothetical protein
MPKSAEYRRWSSPGTPGSRRVIERAARLGYLAKGVLYCTIGALAVMAAVGDRDGELTDSKGALSRIVDQPFGTLLVAVVALGLAGYGAWQFLRAAYDPEPRTSQGGNVVRRLAYVVNGLAHAGLAIYAIGLLVGTPPSDGEETRGLVATVLAFEPIGKLLVGAAGVALGIFAAREIFVALSNDVVENLDLRRVHPPARPWIRRFGRFGRAARGVVLSVVAVGLVFAAAHANAYEAKDFGDALATLQTWAFGWVVLALVAIGLVAYGLFEMIEARFRIVRVA